MAPLRIGVNALYLIPGGVGGTEIYLRHLLAALAAIDGENEYLVFTNRETDSRLAPAAANFHTVPSRQHYSHGSDPYIWRGAFITDKLQG